MLALDEAGTVRLAAPLEFTMAPSIGLLQLRSNVLIWMSPKIPLSDWVRFRLRTSTVTVSSFGGWDVIELGSVVGVTSDCSDAGSTPSTIRTESENSGSSMSLPLHPHRPPMASRAPRDKTNDLRNRCIETTSFRCS